jgi:hypothetical protein
MFKKFKDRLTEVSEEVKKDPRFVNGIASVNQLAQQTVAAIKNDKGSNESLNHQNQTPSFSQLQEIDSGDVQFGIEAFPGGTNHKRSRSNDLQDYFNNSSDTNTLQVKSERNLTKIVGILNHIKETIYMA